MIGSDALLASASLHVSFVAKNIDPYPELSAQLPFPCHFDPDQDYPSLTIQLHAAPDDRAKAVIRNQLLAWAAACAKGVYAAVLVGPQNSSLLAGPDDIEFVDEEVSFSISRFRCHQAALRGLVNACAALLSVDIQIASLIIE